MTSKISLILLIVTTTISVNLCNLSTLQTMKRATEAVSIIKSYMDNNKGKNCGRLKTLWNSYIKTENMFKSSYNLFNSKVDKLILLLKTRNDTVQPYAADHIRQLKLLTEVVQSISLEYSVDVRIEPINIIRYQKDFVRGLDEKLIEIKHSINKLKDCHEKFNNYLEEMNEVKGLIDLDRIYQKQLNSQRSIPGYEASLQRGVKSLETCRDEEINSLILNGHNIATIALKRFPKHYSKYTSFKDRNFSCSIGIVINTPKQLIDETNQMFNRLDDIMSQYIKKYTSQFKSVYETLKSHSEQKIQEMLKSQRTQADDWGEKTLCSMNRFPTTTLNSIKSKSEARINEYRGYIAEDILGDLQSKIDSMDGHMSRYNAIDGKNNNNSNRKTHINGKIAHTKTELNKFNDTFQNTLKQGEAHMVDLDAIIENGITTQNIQSVSLKVPEIKYMVITQLIDYIPKYNSQLETWTTEQQTISREISLLDSDLEANENSLTQLLYDFNTTKDEIEHILNIKIPSAVKTCNLQYLNNHLTFEDPTDQLKVASELLDSVKKGIPQIESEYNSTNTKINNLKTNLNNYSTQIDQVKSEYDIFMPSTASHESKLLHWIAIKTFEPVKAFYESTRNTINNMVSTLTNIEPKMAQINTYATSSKKTIDSLKSSIDKASGEATKIKEAKNILLEIISKPPAEFRQNVTEKLRSLNLNLNSTPLLTFSRTAKAYYLNIETLQNTSSSNIQHLESSMSTFVNVINYLKESKTIATELVNTKRTELTNLITKAVQTNLDATKLEESSTKKHSLVTTAEQTKKREIALSIEIDNTSYGRETQKVLTTQEETKTFFDVIKDFYATKYNVTLKDFDEKYSTVYDKYNRLLQNLTSQNDVFTQQVSRIRENLDDLKNEASAGYNTEITMISNLKSSINMAFSALKGSTDAESYDNLVSTSRNTLSAYSDKNKKNAEYNNMIDTKVRELSNLNISPTNYLQFGDQVNGILSEAKKLITEYELALKSEYININKISFDKIENQQFFDSAEQHYRFVDTMSLVALETPTTTPYNELVGNITKQTEKLDVLKSEHTTLNVDSIVSKFYENLPASISSLTQKKNTIIEKRNMAASTYNELSSLLNNFNNEKKSFESLYHKFEASKTNYNLKINRILYLSNDKTGSNAELNIKINILTNEKAILLNDIDEKSSELNKLLKTLRTQKSDYEQLSSTLESTTNSLQLLKGESDAELTSLSDQNEELKSILEKASSAVVKKEGIVLTLNQVIESLKSFISEYPNSLDSQKTGTIGAIDGAISSLNSAKSTTVNDKAKLTRKIDQFSELFGISKDEFSSEMTGIITSENDRSSTNEKHCNRYIKFSDDKKAQVKSDLENLKASFIDKSVVLSSELTNVLSQLNCQVNILNGQECNLGSNQSFDECISHIENFDASRQENSVNSFKEEFTSLLEDKKLQNGGDEFGVEALKNMQEDSILIDEKVEQLEELFKRELKRIQVEEVAKLLSTLDQNPEPLDPTEKSSLDLITASKNAINSKLDDYTQKINGHEMKYTVAKSLFSMLSLKAEALANSIVGESKNTHIKEKLLEEPTVANTFTSYANELSHDERFVGNAKESINKFESENQEIFGTSEANRKIYTELKNDISDLKNQLESLANNNAFMEKDLFKQSIGKIRVGLSGKESAIESARTRISDNENVIKELNSKLNTDYGYSMTKIGELTKIIDTNKAQEIPLFQKLNSLKESSSLINKSLSDLSNLKEKLHGFVESLNTQKDKVAQAIKSQKEKLTESETSKKSELESKKKIIDNKMDQYFKSFQELLKKADDANIDIPKEITEKYIESVNLKSSIELERVQIEDSFNDYNRNGITHYELQETAFNNDNSKLSIRSHVKILEICALEDKVIKLNTANNPKETHNEYETLSESVEKLLAVNKDNAFIVKTYKDDVNITFTTFTAENQKDIEQQIEEIEKTSTIIVNSSASKESEKKIEENIVDDDYDPYNTDLDPTAQRQVVKGKASEIVVKDYFKAIVVVASLAILAMVIAGATIYYKKMKKKEIYSKCENVYVKVRLL